MSAHTSTQTIATMQAALDYLAANYQTLDINVIRATRANAMNDGRSIMDDPNSSKADFMAAYDLVIELDRVGY